MIFWGAAFGFMLRRNPVFSILATLRPSSVPSLHRNENSVMRNKLTYLRIWVCSTTLRAILESIIWEGEIVILLFRVVAA